MRIVCGWMRCRSSQAAAQGFGGVGSVPDESTDDSYYESDQRLFGFAWSSMHPFHPLFGRPLEVLAVRRHGAGRLYVCDGGALGGVGLLELATDRGPEPAERQLTFEMLAGLATVVGALGGSVDREGER